VFYLGLQGGKSVVPALPAVFLPTFEGYRPGLPPYERISIINHRRRPLPLPARRSFATSGRC